MSGTFSGHLDGLLTLWEVVSERRQRNIFLIPNRDHHFNCSHHLHLRRRESNVEGGHYKLHVGQ